MAKANILIVEDENIVALDIRNRLNHLGYNVCGIIGRGEEVFKKAEELSPDLVLMDIKLKGNVDGIEAAGMIRDAFNIPVVYLTAYTDEHTLSRAKVTEPFGYVMKPFQDRELRAVIEVSLYKHKTEIKLRDSETRFKELAELLPETIFETDLKGNLTFVNHSAFESFGYTQDEFNHGLNGYKILAPEDRERAVETVQKVLKGEIIGSEEYAVIRKDGRTFPVLMRLSPILNTEAQPVGLRGLAVDITEKKRLENKLQQARKMESIGTIAGGVAHNFRNILAGILASTQLIRIKYDDHPGLMEILDRAENSVKRGTELVNGLMQYSRKERSKTFHSLELVKLIHHTCAQMRKSFDKTVTVKTDTPESIWLFGDPSGLSQVIMNLCTNARDAMPDGGIISLEAKEEGEEVKLAISDSGHGMDRETARKCFDPFFTTKEVDKGTGLGLSTTQGIIREHGGYITCYSEKGQGTTFKIHLPSSSVTEKGTAEIRAELIFGNREKILIVEDEVGLSEALGALLQEMNYCTAVARNGNEAIVKYCAFRPDAVLMDRNMPDMDGISCTKQITNLDSTAKIVLMSGYDDNGPSSIAFKTRSLIDGYLTKPIDAVELGKTLAGLFSR
jgi:PAS domain S-box-containing protein